MQNCNLYNKNKIERYKFYKKNKSIKKIYKGIKIYSYKLNCEIIIIKRTYNKYNLWFNTGCY